MHPMTIQNIRVNEAKTGLVCELVHGGAIYTVSIHEIVRGMLYTAVPKHLMLLAPAARLGWLFDALRNLYAAAERNEELPLEVREEA